MIKEYFAPFWVAEAFPRKKIAGPGIKNYSIRALIFYERPVVIRPASSACFHPTTVVDFARINRVISFSSPPNNDRVYTMNTR